MVADQGAQTDWVAIIHALAMLITAITAGTAAVMAAMAKNRASAVLEKTNRLGVALEVVHQATNSMKDALVKSTSESSHAAGEKQGRADERQERADDRDTRSGQV